MKTILFERLRRTLVLGIAVMIALAAYVPAKAADGPDYGALIRDLTKMEKTSDRMTVVMWMPEEFWKLALSANGRLSQKGISDTLDLVRPYTLIAVLDGQSTAFGGYSYTDDQTLITSVRLEDSRGALYQPLDPDHVSGGIRNLLGAMRPVMANMMGAMGQHMVFLAFPGTDKAGKPIADETGTGSLTVRVGDVALRYQLPLPSLLPASLDPKTGESFPGTYRFNPYTGDKLTQGHWSGKESAPSGSNEGSSAGRVH